MKRGAGGGGSPVASLKAEERGLLGMRASGVGSGHGGLFCFDTAPTKHKLKLKEKGSGKLSVSPGIPRLQVNEIRLCVYLIAFSNTPGFFLFNEDTVGHSFSFPLSEREGNVSSLSVALTESQRESAVLSSQRAGDRRGHTPAR